MVVDMRPLFHNWLYMGMPIEGHDGVMTVLLALVGLLALVATLVALVRAIATDGYGTRPPPRSHQEELGPWITQHLSR